MIAGQFEGDLDHLLLRAFEVERESLRLAWRERHFTAGQRQPTDLRFENHGLLSVAPELSATCTYAW